jgi:hypothetical protein
LNIDVAETKNASNHLDPLIRVAFMLGLMHGMLRSLAPTSRRASLADPCNFDEVARAHRLPLIAATALVHSMTVVTRNVADFELTGVPLLNPWNGSA